MNARRMFRASLAAAALLASGAPFAGACSVCFSNSQGPIAGAMNAAILALLACVAGVLASFAAFVIHLARQAARTAEPDGPRAGGLEVKGTGHA